MPYRLLELAAGSYDVLLNGSIVASLVRYQSPTKRGTVWTAELLSDLSPEEMPKPFTAWEHTFKRLEEARAWLGAPVEGQGIRSKVE